MGLLASNLMGCAKMQWYSPSNTDSPAVAANGTSSNTDSPVIADTVSVDRSNTTADRANTTALVSCDPFATTKNILNSGINQGVLGAIYYQDSDQNLDSEFDEYFKNGVKASKVEILFSQLFLFNKSTTTGFSGSDGTELTRKDGSLVNSSFALDLNSTIVDHNDGDYEFLVISNHAFDLSIGGSSLLSSSDSGTNKVYCSSVSKHLSLTAIAFNLKYLQTSDQNMNLAVMKRKVDSVNAPCDTVNKQVWTPSLMSEMIKEGWVSVGTSNFKTPAPAVNACFAPTA